MKPENARILQERAAKLTSLQNHEGFQELLKEFSRRKDRDLRVIVADLKAGTPVPEAQRRIDYARGFDAALKWVENVVSGAEKALEKALEATNTRNEVNE